MEEAEEYLPFQEMAAKISSAPTASSALSTTSPASYADTFGGQQVIIGVSGIIGAGKSTLTEQLAEKLSFVKVSEPVKDNPYLPLFYQDMAKYGFSMQVFLLNHRFQQHQAMVWGTKSSIQDRTIYEDVIFAKLLHESGDISDLDFTTYKGLFANMTNFLHRPDAIVYLDVSVDTAIDRIIQRGRECEKNIPRDYLEKLKKGYEDWLTEVDGRIPVVRIDWNKYHSPEEVIEEVKKKMKRSLLVF